MNSALQCLSNTKFLSNYMLSDYWMDDVNTQNPLGTKGEVAY